MQSYIHHLQGRLRVRCPLLKRNLVQADAIQKLLESQPGIRECDINAVTGSILIRYDEAFTSADGIVSYLKGLGYLSSENMPARVEIKDAQITWRFRLSETKSKLSSAVMNAVFEELVERSAIALIKAVL
jgi:hypothetical protein